MSLDLIHIRRQQKRNRYLRLVGQNPTIPAFGTVRRVRALQALGWTVAQIAEAGGVGYDTVRNVILGRSSRVYRSTADALACAFEQMSMQPAPDCLSARRARAMAARRDWAAPLAWDDIDDPNESPAINMRAAGDRQTARGEDFAWLIANGESEEQAAARLGARLDYLRLTLRRRHDRTL